MEKYGKPKYWSAAETNFRRSSNWNTSIRKQATVGKKIVTSTHSTQQMKTICTKILAERAIVTKSDKESAKGKTETSDL